MLYSSFCYKIKSLNLHGWDSLLFCNRFMHPLRPNLRNSVMYRPEWIYPLTELLVKMWNNNFSTCKIILVMLFILHMLQMLGSILCVRFMFCYKTIWIIKYNRLIYFNANFNRMYCLIKVVLSWACTCLIFECGYKHATQSIFSSMFLLVKSSVLCS